MHCKSKLSHYTPLGRPSWLLPLLVLVETVRDGIRCVTLRVRLAANITAGHIILNLLSGSLLVGFVAGFFLFLLETLVAVVQPIVFCLLASLYLREAFNPRICVL